MPSVDWTGPADSLCVRSGIDGTEGETHSIVSLQDPAAPRTLLTFKDKASADIAVLTASGSELPLVADVTLHGQGNPTRGRLILTTAAGAAPAG